MTMPLLTPLHGKPLNGNAFGGFTLRDDQKSLRQQIAEAYRAGKRRIAVQAACSYGKTILSADIGLGALAKGHRAIFTVPSINLVEQTAQKFFRAGIYHSGIIQADHPGADLTAPMQIASIQSLIRRKRIPDAKVVMLDEFHIWYKFYEKWMNDPAWEDTLFIAWSATPWTKGLAKHFDHFIVAATLKEMIDLGLSCDFDPYAPKSKITPDLSGVDIVTTPQGERDYNTKQLSKIMRDPTLVGDCVREWLERGENEPTLLFGVDRAHAKELQIAFEKAGVPMAYMDKDTKPNERTKIAQQLEAGEIRGVSQIATCIYGVDWPFLGCISWNCPTKSEMKFVQGFGRGVRLNPAKPNKRLIFIDHSKTTASLGLPTEIHYSELCDGTKRSAEKRKAERKEREEKAPWECPICGYQNKANIYKCADEGCDYGRRRSNVEYVPGEIVPVRVSTKREISLEEKQRWYSQLLAVADEKGNKEGWAQHKFKKRFKAWPDGLSSERADPTPDVRNYARAANIRWAYSRSNPRNSKVA